MIGIFNKTEITVHLAQEYLDFPMVSRSLARRILSNIEKFKVVFLDFANIETIGQGFADEIFRVFKNKKDIIRLINFSFFGLLICQGTYFLAIKYTNAGMATVIQFTGPVMIMAFYCIVNRRAPLPREVIAITAALFGVVLMATHLDFSKLNISSLGLFWGILSAIGLASYNISSLHLTAKYGVMPTIAWGLLISGIVIYFGTGSYYVPQGFSYIDFLCISGIILIGTITSFSLYLEGVRLIGAVKGSIIGCLEPIAAIVFSFLLLGSTFGIFDILGAAFILLAVIVLSKR